MRSLFGDNNPGRAALALEQGRVKGLQRIRPHFEAGAQLGLGFAQVFMAVFSIALLYESGVNRWTLAATIFTTLLTLMSRVLFHRK